MRTIWVTLLFLIGVGAQTASAQTPTEGDAKVTQLHQEHPELGFMFLDVLVLQNGQWKCKPKVTLTSNTGKTAEVKVFTDDPMLSPIHSGEIVNAGYLVVDVVLDRRGSLFQKATYRVRAKAEDLDPDANESLARRAPATFAKAKRRYLAISSKLKWVDPASPPAKN